MDAPMQGATEFSSMAKESDENSMPVSALPEEEEAAGDTDLGPLLEAFLWPLSSMMVLMASKKAKNTAVFTPLLIALGPIPVKKALMPCPSAQTDLHAPMTLGLEAAEHIILVL